MTEYEFWPFVEDEYGEESHGPINASTIQTRVAASFEAAYESLPAPPNGCTHWGLVGFGPAA